MKIGDTLLGLAGAFIMGSYVFSKSAYSSDENPHSRGYNTPIGADLTDQQLMEAVFHGAAPSSSSESAPMIARMQADYSLEKGTMPAVNDPAFVKFVNDQIAENVKTLGSKDHDSLHLLAVNANVAASDVNVKDHATLVGLLTEVASRANARGGA